MFLFGLFFTKHNNQFSYKYIYLHILVILNAVLYLIQVFHACTAFISPKEKIYLKDKESNHI